MEVRDTFGYRFPWLALGSCAAVAGACATGRSPRPEESLRRSRGRERGGRKIYDGACQDVTEAKLGEATVRRPSAATR